MRFVDDFSRYSTLYALRNYGEVLNIFLNYKAQVKPNLIRKLKELDSREVKSILEQMNFFF